MSFLTVRQVLDDPICLTRTANADATEGGHMKELIANHRDMEEELPLIHTSKCDNLSSILSTSTLRPSHCATFNESLLYFFYGRPSYKSAAGGAGGVSMPLCPVCFVFKPSTASRNVRGVYPCDTGAVVSDRFRPEIRPADLRTLALHPIIESARRAVSLLFQTNNQYFCGKVANITSLQGDAIEARFYHLLRKDGPDAYDDRKSSIEVQVSCDVRLKDQLLFVVLPREFLEMPDIRHAILNEWNCDPVPYPTFLGDSPSAYYSVVRQLVFERFISTTRI